MAPTTLPSVRVVRGSVVATLPSVRVVRGSVVATLPSVRLGGMEAEPGGVVETRLFTALAPGSPGRSVTGGTLLRRAPSTLTGAKPLPLVRRISSRSSDSPAACAPGGADELAAGRGATLGRWEGRG